MIAINIEGVGTVRLADGVSVGFKKSNPQYIWGKLEVGRSVGFQIPGTDENRSLLGWSDIPSERGGAMRVKHKAQMLFDSAKVDGVLVLNSFKGGSFECTFLFDYPETLGNIDNLNLKDITLDATTWPGLQWSASSSLLADNPALLHMREAIIQYYGSYTDTPSATNFTFTPAVNLRKFTEDVLAAVGVPCDVSTIPSNLWGVWNSMRNGPQISGTIEKDTMNSGTIAANLQPYFSFEDGKLYYNHHDGLINWGVVQTVCKFIKCERDCQLTFPNDFPNNVAAYAMPSYKSYVPLFGYGMDSASYPPIKGQPLAGRTVDVKKGTMFVFLDNNAFGVDENDNPRPDAFGWLSDYSPFSHTFQVAAGDLVLGDWWSIQPNMPDCTVAEWLHSMALLSGSALKWDDADGVVLFRQDVGSGQMETLRDRVSSIDEVTRRVEDWGTDTRRVVVRFDSEDYVTDFITDQYEIDNGTIDAESEETMKLLSEGNDAPVSGFIHVSDYDINGADGTFKASKITVGLSGVDKVLARFVLPRLGASTIVANASTCVRMRVQMDLADFFALHDTALLEYGGLSYTWTSAQWQDGFTTLVLQAYVS